ncbi:hypothetical protein ATANTOWER_018680 [Ataeniobius toweri]|uniref:Uncharacterized protein n=1 Tax=Ataeniobius toweri TaxID=208326 RepID=A0ABU7B0G0_9TELE|nr:hypothetical protein [Ataeniobius toweri]
MLPNCKIISQLEICVSMNVSIILHEPFLVGKHLCLVILVSDALLEFMMLCVIYNKQEYWEIHSSESDRERDQKILSPYVRLGKPSILASVSISVSSLIKPKTVKHS